MSVDVGDRVVWGDNLSGTVSEVITSGFGLGRFKILTVELDPKHFSQVKFDTTKVTLLEWNIKEVVHTV